jgi:hypothetical protein
MTSPLQQKLKVTGPVVITANRLGDGAVVYRSADGSWTKDLAAAAVVTTTPAAMELLTAALSDKLEAVDAYVAPVELTPQQRVLPGNLRERIRFNGPTVALPARVEGRPCIFTTTSIARSFKSACANSATKSTAACRAS